MKKTLYIFASLTAVLFASCAKEADVKDDSLVTGTTLRASVEGVDTKVSANAAGVYKWQASDKIAVLDDAGTVYEFSAASAGATSEFSCASSITLGSYAAYPYSASFAASGDAVTFVIPSTITYSTDATNMPMLGKISGDVVTFKAVGGLLKLIVYGVPEGSSHLEFAAKAQKVSGSFAIADASVDAPVIATAAKGASDNTITIDYTGKYSSNMVFYIPLPTGTIEGFDLTFNGTGSIHKSVTKDLVVARNGIILAPTLNMVTPTTMWSEDFTGYAADAKFNNSDIQTTGSYTAVAYGGAAIKYTTVDGNSDTKMYDANNVGGLSPELLINKKKDEKIGSFTVSGIPTLNNTTLSISFKVNGDLTFSSTTEGVSVNGTYNSTAKTYDGYIYNPNGASSLDLTMTNNSTSSNIRVDNFVVKTAAPSPYISFDGNGARTIAVGANTASSNVTGVTLTGAIDGTGIGISTSENWLSASLTGSTLAITSTEYNHTEEDRIGYVYLKATGASTKQITVTQKPSIVSSPDFTITPGDKTFSISWTPDDKAKNYVAYYSTTDNMADPTQGTALTINTSSTPYTAAPSVDLDNDTPYYVYVKVNSVKDAYSAVYAPSSTWVKKSATPTSGGGGSPQTSTLNFTAACGGSGTADDGAVWTVTSDAAESNFDATNGIHYGTNSANVTYVQLTTSDISGTVTQVVVRARDARATATISVTVGDTAYTCSGSATATNDSADYTFTGSSSGEIVVRVARAAANTKAIYVKSVAVTH